VVDGFSNRLMAFRQTAGTASTSVVYEHNAKGDLTSDGLRTYTYDAEGRLSAATTGATDTSPTTRYAHNALGQRVFKTEPLYPPAEGDEADPGFMQGLLNFFTKRWGPGTSDAEKQGFAFIYDEDGTLLVETGTGGANSAGSTQYIYLPTANGPMPIAAVINGQIYSVHSDHLNTPRRLTDSQGQAVWQWAYSAFGDEKPTIGKYRFANLDINPNSGTTNISSVVFNVRHQGQYEDVETGLSQNWHRYYDKRTGRYTQGDLIGLAGGWNTRTYALGNPLKHTDFDGLQVRWQPSIPGGPIPGMPRPRPIDPSEPLGPTYTPVPSTPNWFDGLTLRRPKWPSWSGDNEDSDGEPWPKDDKNACIRTYANCKNYGWSGSCQACLDQCIASGGGEWPFDICTPPKMKRGALDGPPACITN
jgi:RHS repeat-associated protein